VLSYLGQSVVALDPCGQ